MLPINILQSLIARTRNDLRHQHERLNYYQSCVKELYAEVAKGDSYWRTTCGAMAAKNLLEFNKERVSTYSKKIKKLVECQKALKCGLAEELAWDRLAKLSLEGF